VVNARGCKDASTYSCVSALLNVSAPCHILQRMATRPQATSQPESGSPPRQILSFFLVWVFVIALAVLAVSALKAPEPKPATAPEIEFSAERALVHVREIARVPHPLGSAADATVRDYLMAQLTQLGLQPQIFTSMGVRSSARQIVAGKVNDIVGRLPGAVPGPAIMLMAHYDSVYRAPGAGDDGSGVATILEVVRALKHSPPLQRDIIVLLTDGEEEGLLGAEAFAHSHPWMKDVGLIMNFEARGNRGPSLLFETSTNNQPLIEAVARVAPHPIGSSFFYALYKLLPNDTDFTVFRPAEIPGLNFAFGEGLEAYHSPLDTPEHISLASLQHHGSYGLALTRYFGQIDLSALRKSRGDDVFFDWFGSRLIAYSQRWVLPGQILVTALLALSLLLSFRRREVSARSYFRALFACLGLLVLIVASAAAGWWLISLVISGRRIISDSPANLFLLCGLMLLGACAGTLVLGWFRRRFGLAGLSLAALSFWLILSWLLALKLPSGSYLLFWPLLLAIAGNLSVHLASSRPATQFLRNLPATAATVLLFAPVIYLLYVFLTLQMISVVASAVLLALFILIAIPFLEPASRAPRSLSLATIAVAAVVCLASGVALSRYTPEHPRPDSILYSLNADDNSAAWISYDPKPDDWTRQFLGANPKPPHPVQNYLAGYARPLISAGTPVLSLAPPLIENVEHKQEGTIHKMKFTLRSQRNAETLYLRFPDDVQPISLKVAGREVPLEKGGRLGLTLFAFGDQGVEVEMAVTAPSTISFWVMDRSYGLPVDAQPRPANVMGINGSDVTFVCRKYTL
jgi:hypothetical protein